MNVLGNDHKKSGPLKWAAFGFRRLQFPISPKVLFALRAGQEPRGYGNRFSAALVGRSLLLLQLDVFFQAVAAVFLVIGRGELVGTFGGLRRFRGVGWR